MANYTHNKYPPKACPPVDVRRPGDREVAHRRKPITCICTRSPHRVGRVFALEIRRQTHFLPSPTDATANAQDQQLSTHDCMYRVSKTHECVLTAGGRIAGVMKWRRVVAVSAGRPSPGLGLSSFRVQRQNRCRKHASSSTRIYCFAATASHRPYLPTRTRRPRVWKNRTVHVYTVGARDTFLSTAAFGIRVR